MMVQNGLVHNLLPRLLRVGRLLPARPHQPVRQLHQPVHQRLPVRQHQQAPARQRQFSIIKYGTRRKTTNNTYNRP